MTLYIDGLSKTIQTIFARHRESTPRRKLPFKDLVHFARSGDEAVRERARQNRPYNRTTSAWTPPQGGQYSNLPRPQTRPQQCSVTVLEDDYSNPPDDIDIMQDDNYNDGNPQQSDYMEE